MNCIHSKELVRYSKICILLFVKIKAFVFSLVMASIKFARIKYDIKS